MKLLKTLSLCLLQCMAIGSLSAEDGPSNLLLHESTWPGGQPYERYYYYRPEVGTLIVFHGEFQRWFENGILRRESMYNHGDLVREHAWEPNPDGGPHLEWIIENIDGDEYKWRRAHHDNGSVSSISNSRNGQAHGHQQDWGDDGTLLEDSHYKEGVLVGRSRGWFENGKPHWNFFYVDGQLHGTAEYYYDNGNPSSLNEYDHGVLDGASLIYNSDGSLRETAHYKAGVYHGTFRSYGGESLPQNETEYVNGNKTSFTDWDTSYLTNQRFVRQTGQFRDGSIKVGTWKYYTSPDFRGSPLYKDTEYDFNNDGRVIAMRKYTYYLEGSTRKLTFEVSGSPDRLYGFSTGYFLDGPEGNQTLRQGGYEELYGHYDLSSDGLYWGSGWTKDALHGQTRIWSPVDLEQPDSYYLRYNRHYVDGIPQGDWIEYYPSGQIYSLSRLVDGEYVRTERYAEDGGLLYESQKVGAFEEYIYYVTKGTYRGRIKTIGSTDDYAGGCGTQVTFGVSGGSWPDFIEEWKPLETLELRPCESWPDPDNPNPPDPNATYTTITGTVRDKVTRQPIEGARIGGATHSVTTDENGRYTLEEETGVDVNFSADHTDYHEYRDMVLTDNRQSILLDIELTLDPNGRDPHVSGLEGTYSKKWDGFFLAGVPVNEEYWSWIDWNGETPGSVHLFLNEHEYVLSDLHGYGTYGQTMDPSVVFTESASTGENTVRMTVRNQLGNEVHSETKKPILCPQPSWAQTFGNFTGSYNISTRRLEYNLHTSFPDKPFSFLVTQDTVTGLAGDVGGAVVWTAWEQVPLLGGEEFGVKPTYAEFDMKVISNGSGSAKAGGTAGFVAFGKELEGSINGQGTLRFINGSGLQFDRAQVGMEIKGKLSESADLTDLVPSLKTASDWPLFIGETVTAFSKIAEASASVAPSFSQEVRLTQSNDKIVMEPLTGDLSVETELGLSTTLYKLLKANLTGGGLAQFDYEVPSDYGLTGFHVSMEPKLELQAVSWKREFAHEFTFSLPYEESPSPARDPAPAVWEVIDRDFLDAPASQTWAAIPPPADVPQKASDPADPAEVLLTNPYTLPEANLALSGQKRALVWVHHDGGIPTVIQANEIRFAYHNGTAWETPMQITNDARSDYQPQVMFDDLGRVIAVWVHTNTDSLTDQSTLDDMVPHWEIHWAVYDPNDASPAWSTPASLSSNTHSDFAPAITCGPDGSVRVFWQSNSGNSMEGTVTHPTKIHTALWDSASGAFASTTILTEDFVGWPVFTHTGGSQAAVAWIKDLDGDILTADDTEIWAMLGNGTSWGSAFALSNDGGTTPIADESPNAVTLANGTQAVMWRRDNAWVWVPDLGSPAMETLADDSGEFSMQGAQVVALGNNLALAWPSRSDAGPDIAARIYDTATGTWSERSYITLDDYHELGFCLASDISNDSTIELVTHRSSSDGTTSDLALRSIAAGADLTFPADVATAVTLDPVGAMPGASVTVTVPVVNNGLFAASNASASIYLVNADGADTLLDTASVTPATLVAGTTGSVNFSIVVPEDAVSPEYRIELDEANAVAETDELNNSVILAIFRPDLEPLDAWLSYNDESDPGLAVEVTNNGNQTATDAQVAIIADGLVYGLAEIPELLPGRSATVRITLTESELRETNDLLVISVDPQNAIAESDELNNVLATPFLQVDDLDADGLPDPWEYIWIDQSPTDAFSSLKSISPTSDDDDDGLSNQEEHAAGSNPWNADTDSDTMPDGWEVRYGLDPTDPGDALLSADTDLLNNAAEFSAGSDPTVADTDGEGLDDNEEVLVHETDPTKPDTDDDGLSDYDEVYLHSSNPKLADSDGDGMPDKWETEHGLNVNGDDSTLNTDGDTLTHAQEWAAGTNPHASDSDGDSLDDGVEVNTHHTDPTLADTDGDGQPDANEITAGTDPLDDLEYPELLITTVALPEAFELIAYSAHLTAVYASAPERWSLNYTAYTSEESPGIPFPDMGASQAHLLDPQTGTAVVDLPFAFPLFGESHDRMTITDSGAIMFAETSMETFSPALQAWQNTVPMLSPMLNGFDFSGHGNAVHVDTSATGKVTVRWEGVYGDLGPGVTGEPIDVAITLYANGEFTCHYGPGNTYGGTIVVNAGDGGAHVIRLDQMTMSMDQAPALHFTPENVLPAGLMLSLDGSLTGVPEIYQDAVIPLRVRDSAGNSTTKSLNLQVSMHPNLRPFFASEQPGAGDVVMGEAESLTFTGQGNDPEGRPLTYRWIINGQEQAETGPSLTLHTNWGDASGPNRTVECHLSDDFWTDEDSRFWTVSITDDNDGDSLANSYENTFTLPNPFIADEQTDHDQDGLVTLEEQQLGTNPDLADTDGDGLSDGYEVMVGKDPLVPDAVAGVFGLTQTGYWEAASGWSNIASGGFDGDTLYVAAFYSGFHVLDVSNSSQISTLFSTSSQTEQIALLSATRLMTSGFNGMVLYDITDPSNVSVDRTYPADYSLKSLHAWNGNLVIVATDYANADPFLVRVRSLADPANPVTIGESSGYPTIHEVAIQGNTLFAATGVSGVASIDLVHQSGQLNQLGIYEDADVTYTRVAVSGDGNRAAFGGNHSNGDGILDIVDVSNLQAPVLVERIITIDWGHPMAWVGDHLAVSSTSRLSLFGMESGHWVEVDGIATPNSSGQWLAVEGNMLAQGLYGTKVTLFNVGSPDSDGNGLNDDWEASHFDDVPADPDADPDGDGLTNRVEQLLLTDPNLRDSDSDGTDDGQELVELRQPTVPDAPADTDGDGFSDAVETLFGSDPNDSNSWPLLTLADQDSPMKLHWEGADGGQYRIEISPDLYHWSTLEGSETTATGSGPLELILPNNLLEQTRDRFFRLRAE